MKKLFIVFATAVLAACCAFTACGTKIADNTEHFDKITKTLKLSKSYEGKSLMSSDGIGAATLIGDTTDGDTSNFSLAEGGSIAVRYQGVDTPESTADVQKWGKAASNFTNERLHAATEIVIESASGGVPEKDSISGTRLMCYVWYKTEKDDFKLLNLELVENGYSNNKENANYAYYSYFQKAEQFARGIKLRLFSELDDPLFDTTVRAISLKDLTENPDKYSENTKVKLDAYVSDRYVASSGAVTLTIGQYDEASGKAYTLALYAGHTSATGNMQVGDLYHVVGTLQKHSGAWQISGVAIDNDQKGKDEKSWRSQRGYYLIFDAANNFFVNYVTNNCYGNLTVTSVKREGTTLTFEGTAPSPGEEATPATFTFTVTVPEGYDGAIKEGSELTISGCYQFEANSGKVTIPNYSKISIK